MVGENIQSINFMRKPLAFESIQC